MKIAIISINMYSKGLNFACPLHNYAFQQFLLKNGIENEILNYTPIYFNNFDMRHPGVYYEKLRNNFEASGRAELEPVEFKRLDKFYRYYTDLSEERERRYDKFQNFINTHYIKTEKVYNSDLLEIEDPGFDCYICCTDVLWKKEPNVGFDRGFFLASKAMENKWKISYAASRGVFFSENDYDERLFLQYIEDIDAISVREESLKNYLTENTSKNITQVLDPVFLHEKEFYDSIIIKPKEKHYIFLYYVMERATDTISQAVTFARAHNLKIIEITDLPLKNGRLSEYNDIDVDYHYDLGIEEWLGYLRHADYVFTNSFHACCFSILFEKQFFAGKRSGDKVTNILRTFDLSNRRINTQTDLISAPFPDIDYTKVRPILDQKRKESSDFILNAIHYMEHTKHPEHSYEWWRRTICYTIRYKSVDCSCLDLFEAPEPDSGELIHNSDGSASFQFNDPIMNHGFSRFRKCMLHRAGYSFDGWLLRFRIDNIWFWYLEDGNFVPVNKYDSQKFPPIQKFKAQNRIPYIPVNGISLMIMEACWEEDLSEYPVVYHSSFKANTDICHFDPALFNILKTKKGNVEAHLKELMKMDSHLSVMPNHFSRPGYTFRGWYLGFKFGKKWYWYLEDGSIKLKSEYNKDTDPAKLLISENDDLPHIAVSHLDCIRLDAVWDADFFTRVKKKLKRLLKKIF
mgnify:CR=1 FL=1